MSTIFIAFRTESDRPPFVVVVVGGGGLPGVHPAVHDRVVHGIGHGQPVERQVHVLYVRLGGQLGHVRRYDEVDVIR